MGQLDFGSAAEDIRFQGNYMQIKDFSRGYQACFLTSMWCCLDFTFCCVPQLANYAFLSAQASAHFEIPASYASITAASLAFYFLTSTIIHPLQFLQQFLQPSSHFREKHISLPSAEPQINCSGADDSPSNYYSSLTAFSP